jgi:hypothetical protein
VAHHLSNLHDARRSTRRLVHSNELFIEKHLLHDGSNVAGISREEKNRTNLWEWITAKIVNFSGAALKMNAHVHTRTHTMAQNVNSVRYSMSVWPGQCCVEFDGQPCPPVIRKSSSLRMETTLSRNVLTLNTTAPPLCTYGHQKPPPVAAPCAPPKDEIFRASAMMSFVPYPERFQ